MRLPDAENVDINRREFIGGASAALIALLQLPSLQSDEKESKQENMNPVRQWMNEQYPCIEHNLKLQIERLDAFAYETRKEASAEIMRETQAIMRTINPVPTEFLHLIDPFQPGISPEQRQRLLVPFSKVLLNLRRPSCIPVHPNDTLGTIEGLEQNTKTHLFIPKELKSEVQKVKLSPKDKTYCSILLKICQQTRSIPVSITTEHRAYRLQKFDVNVKWNLSNDGLLLALWNDDQLHLFPDPNIALIRSPEEVRVPVRARTDSINTTVETQRHHLWKSEGFQETGNQKISGQDPYTKSVMFLRIGTLGVPRDYDFDLSKTLDRKIGTTKWNVTREKKGMISVSIRLPKTASARIFWDAAQALTPHIQLLDAEGNDIPFRYRQYCFDPTKKPLALQMQLEPKSGRPETLRARAYSVSDVWTQESHKRGKEFSVPLPESK